jgi:basic amino acid/polyamine antiporter, APA family
MADLWARQSIASLLSRAKEAETQAIVAHDGVPLERTLTAINLVALGIGAIIGAGIFVLTGNAAAENAGPAISISFVLSGIACGFAGLCYAEMASSVPVAGSAYTYAYATLGEIVAWIIGWDLILEYSLGATTVAIGWSGYVVSPPAGPRHHARAPLRDLAVRLRRRERRVAHDRRNSQRPCHGGGRGHGDRAAARHP